MIRFSQAACWMVLAGTLLAPVVGQRKALDRLPADAEAVTQALPGDVHLIQEFELPGDGRVRAVACGKDELWVVRDELLVLTAGTRKLKRRLPSPEGMLGLAADDRFFYVLEKDAIAVTDPRSARVLRRVKLPEHEDPEHENPEHGDPEHRNPEHSGRSPVAIGVHGDELFVAWAGRMVAIHKTTKKVRECTLAFRSPRWLASNGREFWRGCNGGFARIDTSPRGMRVTPSALPDPYGQALATCVNKRLLLVQSDAAGTRATAAFVDRATALPRESLRLGLRGTKGGLRYQVGPKPIASSAGVAKELQRIRRDPSCLVPGPNGVSLPMPVMLVVYPGVKVREVAAAWDLVLAAGFGELSCVGHDAERRSVVEPPPLPPGFKKD